MRGPEGIRAPRTARRRPSHRARTATPAIGAPSSRPPSCLPPGTAGIHPRLSPPGQVRPARHASGLATTPSHASIGPAARPGRGSLWGGPATGRIPRGTVARARRLPPPADKSSTAMTEQVDINARHGTPGLQTMRTDSAFGVVSQPGKRLRAVARGCPGSGASSALAAAGRRLSASGCGGRAGAGRRLVRSPLASPSSPSTTPAGQGSRPAPRTR